MGITQSGIFMFVIMIVHNRENPKIHVILCCPPLIGVVWDLFFSACPLFDSAKD
jgi:hypothetical protein